MPTYRRLQQYALAISILSIIYNGAEGAVSIAFGAESASRSLVFFGIQSGIEVISAAIVVWRFWNVAKPGEEKQAVLNPRELRFERIATISIGWLLVLLALATEGTAIWALVEHDEPSTSNASLIISASALVCMIAIWLPKRYLAKALNSSAMQGETQCSLSCIQITIVLFAGSLIYKLWRGGWWVDSATSLVLGLMFAREGWKMLKWAMSPSFDGGCCDHCRRPADTEACNVEIEERYRDLCGCCENSEKCKLANECQCSTDSESNSKGCCTPVNLNGNKCCSHDYIKGHRPEKSLPADSACCGTMRGDSCCSPSNKQADKCCSNEDGKGQAANTACCTSPQKSQCCSPAPQDKNCCPSESTHSGSAQQNNAVSPRPENDSCCGSQEFPGPKSCCTPADADQDDCCSNVSESKNAPSEKAMSTPDKLGPGAPRGCCSGCQ